MTNKKNIKTACRMCHGGCGVIVTVENGMVIKIKPDPDSPINKGKMCIKGLGSLELLYHKDRIKYPLKRLGKRGAGRWKRIDWDEAYSVITENISKIIYKYGSEAIAIAQGTGRHHFNHTVRFANSLGTPNWFEPGTAQCFFPRVKTGEITYGCLPVVDYYGETRPECILVWGHNPLISGADGESQFKIREAISNGAKLIVIDPRKISLAKKAEVWLQIRPGTDDAMALAMLHIIINENIYDNDFIRDWTVGFNELKERVKNYTPEWAEKITWVPKEKIIKATRLFARSKPASLEWGVALEQTPNCFQTVRAISLIPGITGNFDIPGGWIEGMQILSGFDTRIDKLPEELKKKRLGEKEFSILSGLDNEFPSAHIPTVFKAMRTGRPYPIKACMLFGNNGLLGFANSRETYKTMMKLDFISTMDLFMTPTVELSDIVLPAASWLELDEIFGVPSKASHVLLVQKRITRIGECKSDEEVFCELAKRLKIDYGADKPEDIFNEQLSRMGERFKQFKGMTFEKIKKLDFLTVPIKYNKYKKRGFNTPSGKMEIKSSILESLGYDGLPDYQEPPESPYSTPDLYKKYPFILTTGGRVKNFFHSEHRQIDFLRKKHPDPIATINSETALELGIKDGDWIYIETLRGRIKQKALTDDGIDKRVINCQHGWWFPEIKTPDHGVWISNVNILTNDKPPYDPIIGTYQLRALLCKIYPVKDQ